MAQKQPGRTLLVDTSSQETLSFLKKSLQPPIEVLGSQQFRYLALYRRMMNTQPPAWLSGAFASNQPIAETISKKIAETDSALEAHDLEHAGRKLTDEEMLGRQRHINAILNKASERDYDIAVARLARLDREAFGKLLKPDFYGTRKQLNSELKRLRALLARLANGQHCLPLPKLIEQHNGTQREPEKKIGMLISFQPYGGMWPVIYAYNLPKTLSGTNADFFISQAKKTNLFLHAFQRIFNPQEPHIPANFFPEKTAAFICFAKDSDQLKLAYGLVEAAKRAFGIKTP